MEPLLVKLPMPGPLGHVNSYLLSTTEGMVLVDLGYPSEEAWSTLHKTIEREKVVWVAITHHHLDHGGNWRRLKAMGLRPAIMDAELKEIEQFSSPTFGRELSSYFQENGADSSIMEYASSIPERYGSLYQGLEGDTLRDGVKVRIGETDIIPVWTPGHTGGHTCFLARGKLISGDHVLQGITPNVSSRLPDDDPLGNYLRSLEKVVSLSPDFVFPAHGSPYNKLMERAQEIEAHHLERLNEIIRVLKQPSTAFQVSSLISWYRPWDELSQFDRFMAFGETLAHLHRLEREGLVSSRTHNGIKFYFPEADLSHHGRPQWRIITR